jgi:ParB-like chromosome segregation protein Spo0J
LKKTIGKPPATVTDMQFKMVSVLSLHSYANNARQHPLEQIKQLRASIREFGFYAPIIIDENGMIIAGHGRVVAAIAEMLSEVPAIQLTGLSKEQKQAVNLADNRLPLNAAWDFDMLAHELDNLNESGFDLTMLGFDSAELNDLIGTDKIPPPPGASESNDDTSPALVYCPECGHGFDPSGNAKRKG